MTEHTVRFLKFLVSLHERYRRFEAKSGFSQGPETGRPILVQRYMYSNERGEGGFRENVPLENLRSLRYFISVSVPSSFEIFQTHLAL